MPAGAQRGDVVVALARSETTYVVRPTAPRRQLVDDRLLDGEIGRAMEHIDGSLRKDREPAWLKTLDNVHCRFVGECFIDGQVAWAVGDVERDYKIFALH